MKDEEFQKKLELILKTFYQIDREVKQYFDKEKFHLRNRDDDNKPYSNESLLDDQYKINSNGK